MQLAAGSRAGIRSAVNLIRATQLRVGASAARFVENRCVPWLGEPEELAGPFLHEIAEGCRSAGILPRECALDAVLTGFGDALTVMRGLKYPADSRALIEAVLGRVVFHHVLLRIEEQIAKSADGGTGARLVAFARAFCRGEPVYYGYFHQSLRGELIGSWLETRIATELEQTFKVVWPQRRFGISVDRRYALAAAKTATGSLNSLMNELHPARGDAELALLALAGVYLLRDRAFCIAEGFDVHRFGHG